MNNLKKNILQRGHCWLKEIRYLNCF